MHNTSSKAQELHEAEKAVLSQRTPYYQWTPVPKGETLFQKSIYMTMNTIT